MNQGERHLCEWQLHCSGGFIRSLFDVLLRADNPNLQRLKLAYPEEVMALYRYRTEDGYWWALEREWRGDHHLSTWPDPVA